jgi:protocatechuate 3,4-dioxygenase beta subunit
MPLPTGRSAERPPQTGTGIIRGRVLDRDTGAPLPKVRVTLRASGVSQLPHSLTDASGYYELDDLPAASFTVTASKGGHVTLEYGQRRPSERGRPVELADGEAADEVDFVLPRGGVIAGQVYDEAGEPLPGAVVQALRPRFDAGQRQAGNSVATDVTDDLGQFRLFGLAQGTFLLSATPSDPGTPDMLRIARATAGPVGNVATFYPSTLLPALAQPLAVDAGGQLGGLVLQIVPHRPLSIAGLVRTSDGSAPPDISLSVGQMGSQGWTGRSSRIAADGSFSIGDLSPGEYALTARALPSGTNQMATAQVRLDGADADVTLTLGPGYDVSGRIAFESAAARSAIDPSTVRVQLEGLDAMPQLFADRAPIRDDWTFEATGLMGRYRFRVTLPAGWAVKSVRHSGTEYTDTPLDVPGNMQGVEVLLTQNLTTVTGRVTDDRGRTITDAIVVVLAEDPERWGERTRFLQTARPDQNGLFTIRALPPAGYVAVALEYLETGEETNPDVLAQLRTMGTRFTLTEGATENMTLRVTAAP